MAEEVINKLADACGGLTGYVLSLQEHNAEAPPQLPSQGQGVTVVAKSLAKIAHDTADREFSKFPDVHGEIHAEASKVDVLTVRLSDALDEVVVSTDRKAAYGELLNCCKLIARSTSIMLILVYGARVTAIQRLAEDALAAMKAMKTEAQNDELRQELVDAIQNAANVLLPLIKAIQARANDVDPEDKPITLQFAKAITDDRAEFTPKFNARNENPDDAGAKAALVGVCDTTIADIQSMLDHINLVASQDAGAAMLDALNDRTPFIAANQNSADGLRRLAADAKHAIADVAPEDGPVVNAVADLLQSAGVLVADVQKSPADAAKDADDLKAKAAALAAVAKNDPAMADVAKKMVAEADALVAASLASAGKPVDSELAGGVTGAAAALAATAGASLDDAKDRKAKNDAEAKATSEAARAAAVDGLRSAAAGAGGTAKGLTAEEEALLDACQRLLDDAAKTTDDIGTIKPEGIAKEGEREVADEAAVKKAAAALAASHGGSGGGAQGDRLNSLAGAVTQATVAHVAACNAAAPDANNPALAARVEGTSADLAAAVKALTGELEAQRRAAILAALKEAEVIAAAALSVEDEPASKELLSAIVAVAAQAPSVLGAGASASALKEAAAKAVESGRAVAAAESNAPLKARLISGTTAVSDASADLAAASAAAAADPSNLALALKADVAGGALAAAVADLAAIANEKHFEEARAALVAASAHAEAAAAAAMHAERTLLANAKVITDAGIALLDATRGTGAAGSDANVEAAAIAADSKALNDHVLRFVDAGKAAAKAHTDPEQKAAIKNSTQSIARDAAAVIKDGLAAVQNAKDYQAKATLDKTSEELARAVEELVAHSNTNRLREKEAIESMRRLVPFTQDFADGESASVAATASAGAAGSDEAALLAAAKTALANGREIQKTLDDLALRTTDPTRSAAIVAASAAVLAAADALEGAVKASDGAALAAGVPALNAAIREALTVAASDAVVADLQGAAFANTKAGGLANAEAVRDLHLAAAAAANLAAVVVGDAKAAPDKVGASASMLAAAQTALESAAAVASLSIASDDMNKAVGAAVSQVKKSLHLAIDAAQSLSLSPDDYDRNLAMRNAGLELANAFNALALSTREKQSRSAAVCGASDALDAAMAKLAGALAAGDVDGVEKATKAAIDAAEEVAALLVSLAGEEKDGARKAALNGAADAIKNGIQALVADSSAWRRNPTSPEAKAKLEGTCAALQAVTAAGLVLAATRAGADDLHDTESGAAAAAAANPDLSSQEKNLLKAIEGVAHSAAVLVGELPGSADANAGGLAASVNVLDGAVKAVLESCPDPAEYKALVAAHANVQGKAAALAAASKTFAGAPHDPAAATEVAKASDALAVALQQMTAGSAGRDRAAVKAEREAMQGQLTALAAVADSLAAAPPSTAGSGPTTAQIAAAASGRGSTADAARPLKAVVEATASLLNASSGAPDKVNGEAGKVTAAAGGVASARGAPASSGAVGTAAASLAGAAKTAASHPTDAGAGHRLNEEAAKALAADTQAVHDLLAVSVEGARAAVAVAVEASTRVEPVVAVAEAPELAAARAVIALTGELLAASPGKVEEVSAQVAVAVAALEKAAASASDSLAASAAAAGGASEASRADGARLAADVAALSKAATKAVTSAKNASMNPDDLRAKKAVSDDVLAAALAVGSLCDSAKARQASESQRRREAVKNELVAAAAVASQESSGDSAELKALEKAVAAFATSTAGLVGTPMDGPAATLTSGAAQVTADVGALAAAARTVANGEPDAHKDKLMDVAASLEAAAGALSASEQALAAHPTAAADDAAIAAAEAIVKSLAELAHAEQRDRHDKLAAKVRTALGGLSLGGIDDTPALDLLSVAKDLAELLAKLIGDLPDMTDPAAVKRATDRLKDLAEDLKKMAQAAAGSDPKLAALLGDLTKGLDKAATTACAAAESYAANPSPAADAAFMTALGGVDNLLDSFTSSCAVLAQELGKPATAASGGGADAVISNLANELTQHAAKYAKGEQKDEPLVILGTELGQLMAQLAAAAREGRRNEIIPITKAIFELCKNSAAACKTVANECTDNKLKNDVTFGANGMKNYSVQLKIIGAVKAASEVADPAAENQLVTCCQGIASCMESAMDACVVAAIRRKK